LRSSANKAVTAARRVSLDELAARSFPIKLRDGLARLFSPYL
jgi:cardiolipin synthase A/B